MVYRFFTAVIFPSLLFYGDSICMHEDMSAARTAQNLCTQAQQLIIAQDYQQAQPLLEEALRLDPHSVKAHFYYANLLFNKGDYEEALHAYEKTAEMLPEHPDIFCNLGICANILNRTHDAIVYFEKAIALEPSCTLAYTQLIASWEKLQNDGEALAICKRLLALEPTHREGLLSAGNIARRMGNFEDAEWYYRAVYTHNAHDAQAIMELASVLTTLEEYEEALELYRDALLLKPEQLSLYYNLGFVLKKLGYYHEAAALYNQVIAQKPDYAMAHFSLGLTYLTLGDLEAGFREYEWRWKAYEEAPLISLMPLWDGSPLAGKKIYVIAEQGYGDTFQFMRYLQLLKKQGAYIIFAPQQALIPLMKQHAYIDEVVSPRDSVTLCDYYAPLMSLPLLCNTRMDTIPVSIPYIQPDSELVSVWGTYLENHTTAPYKVGICWHGNSQYKDVMLRRIVTQKSCPLALFEQLAQVPGVQLFSLQKISGLEELQQTDAHCVHIFPAEIDGAHGRFMDTAAIISQLDLVVSVDTSIAHLAAALGVETWNLLPEPADWRWMLESSTTPWYPNMRLFRQAQRGDWHGLMLSVRDALHATVTEYVSRHSLQNSEGVIA